MTRKCSFFILPDIVWSIQSLRACLKKETTHLWTGRHGLRRGSSVTYRCGFASSSRLVAHAAALQICAIPFFRQALRFVRCCLATLLAAGTLPVSAVDLPTRDPILRESSLSAAPLIVCPHEAPLGTRLGRDISAALQEKFGVQAEVVDAAEFDPRDYGRRTVILLGHIVNNPEMLWLYSLGLCYVDAAYPGKDGFVIRQIHDPAGTGRNVMIVGASSSVDLERGVRRFIAELRGLNEPVWGKPPIVDSSVSAVANLPDPIRDDDLARLTRESLAQMRGGKLWHEAYAIIEAARLWHLSGHEAHVGRYDALTRAHRSFTDSGADQFYGSLEFWLPEYIQAWDLIEEADYWTDAQRKEKTQLILDLTALLATRYGSFKATPKPRPRWNHETHPAMAYHWLSEYLSKHYGDADPGPHYRRLARLVLGDQTQFTRGTDESGLYLAYSPAAAIRYAISTRDADYFESGRAREFGRLLLAMTDNTGRFVGAAEQGGDNIAASFLQPLAAALNDPSFLGPGRRTREAAERPDAPQLNWKTPIVFGEFRPPLPPSMPEGAPQVEAMPLDRGLYGLTHAEQFYTRVPLVRSDVPAERAFDKLVFREDHDPAGQYLLLDGYGRGKHYRLDTQAILRFTDNERVFLVGTDDDQRVSETFHNTMTFLRDGQGHASVPPMAKLEAAVDLPGVGFSRTSVPDYSGIHWIRNVLWLKGSLFVITDQMKAGKEGDYSFRCHWNGLGTYAAEGDEFRLEQKGQTCRVIAGGPVKIRAVEDKSDAAARWSGYPHARPVIHRIRQTRSVRLERGGRASLHNLIYAGASKAKRRVFVERADNDRLVFRDGERVHLFAAGAGIAPDGFSTDARMGLWSEERIALAQATRLTFGETVLWRSDKAIDVEFDLGQGTLPLDQDALRAAIDKLRESAPTTIAQTEQNPVPRLKTVETPLDFEVTASLINQAGAKANAILGSRSHCAAYSVDVHGKVRPAWTVAGDGRVNAISKMTGPSGESLTVFGTQKGELVAVGPDGGIRWRGRIEALNAIESRIVSLAAGDVDSDGVDELFVGTARWYVHAFDASGQTKWKQPVYARQMMSLALGDLSGDGTDELLIGTSYYTLNAYNALGKILFAHTAEPMFQRVLAADLDGDRRAEAVAANVNNITVLDVDRAKLKPVAYRKGMNPPRAARSVRFRFDAGDPVHALAVSSPDNNGERTIIAGAESGFIFQLSRHGKPQRFVDVGDAVLCLATDDERIAAGLRNGEIRAFDRNLSVQGVGRLDHEVKTISLNQRGVVGVTKRSIGWLGWD